MSAEERTAGAPAAKLGAWSCSLSPLPWIAGLLMFVSGQLPEVGERIDCAGWCFEVAALDGRRIDRVLAHADARSPEAAP